MQAPPQFRPGFRPQYRGGGAGGPRGRPAGAPRPQAFIPHIPFDFAMSPDCFPMGQFLQIFDLVSLLLFCKNTNSGRR